MHTLPSHCRTSPSPACTKQHPAGSNRDWQTPQKTHHANRHLESSEPDKRARNGRTHTTDLGTATQAGVRVRCHRMPSLRRNIARHCTRFSAPAPTPQSSTTSLPTFDNHARRLCTRKSTFHLQIQINKTRAVHSPGIDALGFEFTNAQLAPALGAANTQTCVRL